MGRRFAEFRATLAQRIDQIEIPAVLAILAMQPFAYRATAVQLVGKLGMFVDLPST